MTEVARTALHQQGAALATARVAAIVALIGAVISPPLTNVFGLVLLVALALVPDATGRLRRVLAEPLGRGVLVLAGGLLFAFFVGLAQGTSTPSAAFEVLRDWRPLLLLLAALAVFDEPRSKTWLTMSFVVFSCVAAVVALISLELGVSYKYLLPGIILRNRATQSLTFACGAYLAVLLLMTHRFRKPAARIAIAVAALGLIADLLFLQEGRSGHVVLVATAAATVLLFMRGRQRAIALLVAVLLAVLAYGASPNLRERYGQVFDEMRNASTLPLLQSMAARVIIWRTTADLIADRPVLGYGLGGFAPAYAARIKQSDYRGWQADAAADPHNQYAMLWVEGGLPLLLSFVWFLCAVLRQPAAMPYRAAGIALLAAWCINSLVNSHFQNFNEGHLIMLFLGAFLASGPATHDETATSTNVNTASR